MSVSPASIPDAEPPFVRIDGDIGRGLLLLCDHASNRIPAPYGSLGLAPADFERHIAYDIGAAAVTRRLAELTGAPALLTSTSRLLIDPNRGEDDPTLIMRLSDGRVVPGNAGVDAAERERRLALYHRPYHQAIAATVDEALAAGVVPAIFSVHSFTPRWKDWARPWHVAILWDLDPRFPAPLIEALRAEGDLVVGDNEPYDGALKNDTLYRHATKRGLANVLIEIRQDLVTTSAEVEGWAIRLARLLAPILERPDLHGVQHFGSRG
jgi:predicted N-formylglutamate amidohydrolase